MGWSVYAQQQRYCSEIGFLYTEQQHVDGNLRLYKLDSDITERRDSSAGGTPSMPRGPRTLQENHNRTPSKTSHNSSARQHIGNNSTPASPHHSATNQSSRSNSQRSASSSNSIRDVNRSPHHQNQRCALREDNISHISSQTPDHHSEEVSYRF